jgi:serine phosphatase RsbU (regulator of sigma subunit)
MYAFIYSLARRLWPELDSVNEARRLVGVGDVFTVLYTTPLALGGLIWLAAVTDWAALARQWFLLLLLGGLMALFTRLSYFFIVEIRAGRYGDSDDSLAAMAQWAGVFLLGPGALWLSVLLKTVNLVRTWRRDPTQAWIWNRVRNLNINLAMDTVAYLGALTVYRLAGGQIPLPGLSPSDILRAMGALAVHVALLFAIYFGYMLYALWVQRRLMGDAALLPLARFLLLALGLGVLGNPFAILLAGLYVGYGLHVFIFFAIGLLLVAFLARRLSWAAESNRQQSRQLERLEHLGRDILNAPPDGSELHRLLAEHVPAMLPSARTAIWLLPDEFVLRQPVEWQPEIEPVWRWVKGQSGAQGFLTGEALPWLESRPGRDPVIAAPILDAAGGQPIGCIYLELRSLAQPWDRKTLSNLYPALQTLAAEVASALRQAQVYRETLEYQATLQELEFAGRIQAGLLPAELPALHGWELAVTLLPARETYGDYFDIIPLPEGKIGILIADVADKGLGAALYMALSRTLIRTYALQFDASPEVVFFSVNERILQDASTNLFVTAFYGVLDPTSGELLYANAGHSPPLLRSAGEDGSIHALTPTGMPLGVDDGAAWSQERVWIGPGDMLLLYTDGIPDAQNAAGTRFKERRLIEVVQDSDGSSAQEMQTAILNAVDGFVEGAAQFDDITLLVILRDAGEA